MYDCEAINGMVDCIHIFCHARYNKSPAQIMIRWSLQRGFVCIPKTITEERIRENADIFDFSISDEDMQVLVGGCCV